MPCSNGEESGSGALRTRDAADVALVLLNPPILLLVMWAAKRMTGLSYAYLIYDMYPGFPVALDIIPEDRLLVRGWERVMQMVYRDADRIVVLGDSMKRRLASKMEQDSAFSTKKVEGIPNWEDGSFIAHGPNAKTRSPRRGAHGFLCASLFRQHRPQHVQTVLPCIGFPARSFSVTRLWTCGISSSRSSRIALNAFSTSRAP